MNASSKRKAVLTTYKVQQYGSCSNCQYACPCGDSDYYCRLISDPETIDAIIDPNGWCSQFIKHAVTR